MTVSESYPRLQFDEGTEYVLYYKIILLRK